MELEEKDLKTGCVIASSWFLAHNLLGSTAATLTTIILLNYLYTKGSDNNNTITKKLIRRFNQNNSNNFFMNLRMNISSGGAKVFDNIHNEACKVAEETSKNIERILRGW